MRPPKDRNVQKSKEGQERRGNERKVMERSRKGRYPYLSCPSDAVAMSSYAMKNHKSIIVLSLLNNTYVQRCVSSKDF